MLKKLRQQRDDETLSIAKRIEANRKLGKTLKEQGEAEAKIANKAIEIAKLKNRS